MNVIVCDPSHGDAWDAFVSKAEGASLYHRFEWRAVNESALGHRCAYLAAVDGGTVRGVFPIVQVKSRLFGNIACSLPFVNYGGPVGESDAIVADLLRAASEVAEQWRADYVEIRSRLNLGENLPVSTHKVSLTVDLDPDPDKLWNAFKTGHRQDIRRGYKNGFSARFGGSELISDLYTVLSESWRDLGTPLYSQSYLKQVSTSFGKAIRVCVIYDGRGEPAAGALDGLHRGTVEGMWLGMRAPYRKQLVGYVLYWELIRHACLSRYNRFHLGRSTVDSGAEQFKKKWNARVEPLHWHYILRGRRDIPQLNVSNPRYRVAIETWRRLPVSVTQLVGPYIARSIP